VDEPTTPNRKALLRCIFKKRLRAARADTGIHSWMVLLPLIAWVINTTSTPALPRGVTPYEVWFGRKPPTDFQEQKEELRRVGEEGVTRSGEEAEEGLFVDEHFQEEEEQEDMILSELTKRVKEHMVKQQVKKAGAKALVFEAQETATLLIPKAYRFSSEPTRIPVRVLKKLPKVRSLTLNS